MYFPSGDQILIVQSIEDDMSTFEVSMYSIPVTILQ
jgi:hypothetical protein